MSAPRKASPQPSRRAVRSARASVAAPAGTADVPSITAVDADPVDPNLRRVKVGRKTVALLPATAAEALGLAAGVPWSEALAAAVARDAALAAAREKALRSLGRSAATSARLVERLVRGGIAPGVAEEAVASLRRDGWLDERATADALAESAQRRGRVPQEALARRLESKGVEASLASQVATRRGASGDAELEASLAHGAAAARRGGGREAPPRTARRVAAALARRGFDADIIARTLERLGLPTGDE